MGSLLQGLLIVSCIIFFLIIIKYIKKSKLLADIAVVWILLGVLFIILSIFPGIVYKLANIVGILSPSNFVYLVMIFILFCLAFYLCLRLSVLEEKYKNLVQHIGIEESKNEKK